MNEDDQAAAGASDEQELEEVYTSQGYDRYCELVGQLCEIADIPDVQNVIGRRHLEMHGFDIVVEHMEEDVDAMYLQFDFGATTQGRTLRIFRLMLESNYLIYAQDQAQLGLDPDNSTVRLIVRVPMTDDIDGAWLAETVDHYVEHGRYWRENLLAAPEELFEAISAGDYLWLKM